MLTVAFFGYLALYMHIYFMHICIYFFYFIFICVNRYMRILILNSVTNITAQVKSYNQTHQVSYAFIPFLETTLLGPVVLLLHDSLFVLTPATHVHVHVILSVLPFCLSLS